MVCNEMRCSRASYYRYYQGLLRPFSLGGGERRARFCWEDELLRAIARVKGAGARSWRELKAMKIAKQHKDCGLPSATVEDPNVGRWFLPLDPIFL